MHDYISCYKIAKLSLLSYITAEIAMLSSPAGH